MSPQKSCDSGEMGNAGNGECRGLHVVMGMKRIMGSAKAEGMLVAWEIQVGKVDLGMVGKSRESKQRVCSALSPGLRHGCQEQAHFPAVS